MKILYISHKVPYPLSDGGKLRVFNHIKHLSKKHEITSMSFVTDGGGLGGLGELKKYCAVKTVNLPKYKSLINTFFGLFSRLPLRVWYLKDKKFGLKAKELTKEADLVIIQALRMSQYAFSPEKTIIDIVDTPSLQIKRALKYEKPIWKLIWGVECPRILRYEKKVCRKFGNIIVASRDDKKGLGYGVVIKNGAKIDAVNRKESKKNNIMFLGNMEYKPNIDAAEFFIERIFPLIKKNVKNSKFYIVGKNANKIKKYSNRDVIVTGFVKDLGKIFSKCQVFAAPLRLGSGIQNKVLEALNYQIPIVTTSIVNKGVEAKNGEEIIVANNPKDFADMVVMLLKNKKLREKISLNGKKFLKNNYSWKKANQKLDKVIEKIKGTTS